MSHIQFPYRRRNTRRQHSSSDNSDFVTSASHNSIERGQEAHESDSTGIGGRNDGVGTTAPPAILDALAGRRPARTPQ